MEQTVDMIFGVEEVERLPNVDSYDDLPVRGFVRKGVELCVHKAGCDTAPQQSRASQSVAPGGRRA
jgi:hypothetical protein